MNEEDKLYITHKRPNETILYPGMKANAFNLTYLLKDVNQTHLAEQGGLI
jgi:hypothetical protein